MAEISEIASEEGDGNASPSSEIDTKPGTKRLFLTLSVLLSFLLGLPFLLKSTAIYRAPLPFNSMESLASELKSDPPSLPCRFQVVFLRPGFQQNGKAAAENLREIILKQLKRISERQDPSCGSCNGYYSLSIVIESGDDCFSSGDNGERCLWKCGMAGSSPLIGEDDEVDERLDSVLRGGLCSSESVGRVYTAIVGNEGYGNGRVVVGKYRHAWISGGVSEKDTVDILGNIFVKLFMNGGTVEETGQGKGDYMPVGSDGSLVLSFSLLNANPEDWVYDWDFQQVEDKFLAPVVEALAPIASITVESQVLYHSPKASKSSWDQEMGIYSFSTDDLPFFVNSNEWHLDTSAGATGRSKLVHFVVYIPSSTECPLHLRLPNGEISKTNGFISPMWGGVAVWNPPSCSNKSAAPLIGKFTSKDLENLFQVFMGQFRLLFGIRSDGGRADLGISRLLTREKGFAEWELDFLFRQHACFNLFSCATTLESLSKLVQSLPRMIVMEEIGRQVSLSLEEAGSARENASTGLYGASAASSKRARELAEDAFFHPSIMSISYSSLEHYFAIYMPFFAPVSLHVVLAALKEIRRYQVERAKHLRRKA
ncbi:GPI transamidase component PIG-S-like protein [Wolffia australiana]